MLPRTNCLALPFEHAKLSQRGKYQWQRGASRDTSSDKRKQALCISQCGFSAVNREFFVAAVLKLLEFNQALKRKADKKATAVIETKVDKPDIVLTWDKDCTTTCERHSPMC